MLTRIAPAAAEVLDLLTADLAHPGDAGDGCHRRIDNTDEAFMPVIVERIGDDQFSVAHYGEQNGDLMRDPEMVFWRDSGAWFATYFRNDYVGIEQISVFFGESGRPEKFVPELHRDQTEFTRTWMRNIREQQGL